MIIYIYIYIYRYINVIMKTICPPGYHHNVFVATHALEYMIYRISTYLSIYIYNIYVYIIYIYIYM